MRLRNKKIFGALFVVAIATVIVIYFITPSLTGGYQKIIKRSSIQGDEIRDERTPTEACSGSIMRQVQESNGNLNCVLIDARRVDRSPDGQYITECVDGASPAGCFSCTFGCK